MADRIKDIVVGVVLALLAYLKPIEGELSSLMIVFTLNFIFGYLSGMIAKGENFELKKAVVCIGHATVFFVLCAAVYAGTITLTGVTGFILKKQPLDRKADGGIK